AGSECPALRRETRLCEWVSSCRCQNGMELMGAGMEQATCQDGYCNKRRPGMPKVSTQALCWITLQAYFDCLEPCVFSSCSSCWPMWPCWPMARVSWGRPRVKRGARPACCPNGTSTSWNSGSRNGWKRALPAEPAPRPSALRPSPPLPGLLRGGRFTRQHGQAVEHGRIQPDGRLFGQAQILLHAQQPGGHFIGHQRPATARAIKSGRGAQPTQCRAPLPEHCAGLCRRNAGTDGTVRIPREIGAAAQRIGQARRPLGQRLKHQFGPRKNHPPFEGAFVCMCSGTRVSAFPDAQGVDGGGRAE